MTSREPFGQTKDRLQKLMQATKGKVRFRLHADRVQHLDPMVRCLRGGGRKQRRLADSGLAAHEQDPAAASDAFDEIPEDATLGLTPIQDTRWVARPR